MTVTDYAEAIKSSVTMRDVAARYGLIVNRMHKAICPFHNDTKPSMHIYDGKRGYYCFVCNRGGDVIDFVSKLFNLDFLKSCEKLNDDFDLHLPIKEELSQAERLEAERLAEQKKLEQKRREMRQKQLLTAYHAAFDRWKVLDDWMREKAPRTPLDGFSEEYVFACKNIDLAWEKVVEAERMLKEVS